jgi:hypothetical protein
MVSENEGVRRISGPKKEKVTRGWRKLHFLELHTVYSLASVGKEIKARNMRWAEYVARIEK